MITSVSVDWLSSFTYMQNLHTLILKDPVTLRQDATHVMLLRSCPGLKEPSEASQVILFHWLNF